MRVFLDANTIVSGLLFEGNEATLLELGRMKAITLTTNYHVLDEVKRVLARREFDLSRREVEGLMTYVAECLIVVHDPAANEVTPVYDLLGDKKDLPVAVGAVIAEADYLVTGDKELISKSVWQSVKIIKTYELLELIFRKK